MPAFFFGAVCSDALRGKELVCEARQQHSDADPAAPYHDFEGPQVVRSRVVRGVDEMCNTTNAIAAAGTAVARRGATPSPPLPAG